MAERLWAFPEPYPTISASDRALVGIGYGGIPIDMPAYERGEWDLLTNVSAAVGDWSTRQAPTDTWTDTNSGSDTWTERV